MSYCQRCPWLFVSEIKQDKEALLVADLIRWNSFTRQYQPIFPRPIQSQSLNVTLSAVFNYFQPVSTVVNLCQLFSAAFSRFHQFPTIFRCFQRISTFSSNFQLFSAVFNRFQPFSTIFNCFSRFQPFQLF